MMTILGFLAVVLMGILLGLIGGGGSILTIPILVYLFGIEPVLATTYSLFIVGVTSLIGSISHFRRDHVNLKTALVFGIPSIVAVLLVRTWILPAIPDQFILGSEWMITKSGLIMVLFSLLMAGASVSMIRKPRMFENRSESKRNYPLIFAEGLVVGSVTGLVGAGGGFLIIPALVVMAGLPMKEAIGTSLVIISVKSLVGFGGDLTIGVAADYPLLMVISALSIAGILIGSYLCKFISNEKLRPAFGWMVLLLGIVLLVLPVK